MAALTGMTVVQGAIITWTITITMTNSTIARIEHDAQLCARRGRIGCGTSDFAGRGQTDERVYGSFDDDVRRT
jgi:hypothetical protein